MYKGKKILGIIPARGGSKGVPRKNIREICGKPVIAWTIESALQSKYLDKTVVSTDDEEIASISLKYGALVPFVRPVELAGDKTPMVDVILHTTDFFRKKHELFDIIVLLQPTSPLRAVEDIDNSIEEMFVKDAQAIISVCDTGYPPSWVNLLPPDGCMKDFMSQKMKNKNRQEFPASYRLNGVIYASYIDYLKKVKGFFGRRTFAYIMPAGRSIDIDSELDMKLAELLLKAQYE